MGGIDSAISIVNGWGFRDVRETNRHMHRLASRFSIREEALLVLRGLSQIMFQGSVVSGLFFLVGIGIQSGWMAVAGIVGALSGTMTARACCFSRTDLAQGLYGFNGALLGMALLFFYGPSLSCFALIGLGASMSSVIRRVMLGWNHHLPPLSAPFILSAWAMFWVAGFWGMERVVMDVTPHSDSPVVWALRGIAQVMFLDGWIAGVLFFVGLLLVSWQMAAWAVIGSVLGLVTAQALGYSQSLVVAGWFGFNASLTAMALSVRCRGNVILPAAGSVLSTVMLQWFQWMEFPVMTAPFVLSSWAILLTVRWTTTFKEA